MSGGVVITVLGANFVDDAEQLLVEPSLCADASWESGGEVVCSPMVAVLDEPSLANIASSKKFTFDAPVVTTALPAQALSIGGAVVTIR